MVKFGFRKVVENTANWLELVRVADNTANRTGLFRNIAAKITNISLENVITDSAIKLKDLMRKASSDLTVISRRIAKATAVGSTLLLMGTASLFSQTFHIVGTVTDPNTQRTWDQFVTTEIPISQGRTYILTDDVGTPSSTIRKMPVDIIKSF